jgi:NDP-sugar pyrophosphorylase family protein
MLEMPDALVLCGGLGLRLRSVTGGEPKSLAGVGGRPFLAMLLRQLAANGFRRAVLAVGYRREAIEAYCKAESFGLLLDFAREAEPLGTAGAIRNALERIESPDVTVVNGDSYTAVDFRQVAGSHRASSADVTLVAVPADGRRDAGTMRLSASGRVERFEEKGDGPGSGHLNAGIYILSRTLAGEIPAAAPLSMEHEVFPRWIAAGKWLQAFRHPGPCVDIGTPARYRLAQEILAEAGTGRISAEGDVPL